MNIVKQSSIEIRFLVLTGALFVTVGTTAAKILPEQKIAVGCIRHNDPYPANPRNPENPGVSFAVLQFDHAEETGESGNEGYQKADTDKSTGTTNWLIVVGGLEVLVLMGQAWLFYKQGKHFRISERPWLIPSDSINPTGLPEITGTPALPETYTVQIKNFGKTPAWVVDWFMQMAVLEDTNIGALVAIQKPEDMGEEVPFPQGVERPYPVEWQMRDSADIEDIQNGKKHLYLYGYFQYRTTFGKDLCESFFCFHYFHRRDNRGRFEQGWSMEPPEGNYYT
jgi:hypothetical protein